MIKHSKGALLTSVMINNVALGTIGNAHGSGLGLDVVSHEMSHFIDPRGPTCNLEQCDCGSKKKYSPVEAEADMSTENLGLSIFSAKTTAPSLYKS